MKTLRIVCIVLASTLVSAFAQQVNDPVADFLRLAVDPSDKLLKLEVDLNHDGKKEIFISRTSLILGKGRNAWTVYIPAENGYIRVDETDSGLPIDFPVNRYYIGPLQGVQNDVLETYSPGGGGKGVLLGYQIIGKKVHTITIKEDFEPGGVDKETFEKTFGGKPNPAVQEFDIPKQ